MVKKGRGKGVGLGLEQEKAQEVGIWRINFISKINEASFRFQTKVLFFQCSQNMRRPRQHNQDPPQSELPSLTSQATPKRVCSKLQRFPLQARWLKGQEYKKILENAEQYSKQFGFPICPVDQHPGQIYLQPRNGAIYFMKQKEIKSIRFPRTSFRKKYRWKRLNFPTQLPKAAPLVSYVVAACYETDQMNQQVESPFKMHIVQLSGNQQQLILCHIRDYSLEQDKDSSIQHHPQDQTPRIEGLSQCFVDQQPDFYRLFNFLHNHTHRT